MDPEPAQATSEIGSEAARDRRERRPERDRDRRVHRQARLLDLLRQREGGSAHPAVQVHGGCVQRASRLLAEMAHGELREQHGEFAVQGLQLRVRRPEHHQARLGERFHVPTLGQHRRHCHHPLRGRRSRLDRHSDV